MFCLTSTAPQRWGGPGKVGSGPHPGGQRGHNGSSPTPKPGSHVGNRALLSVISSLSSQSQRRGEAPELQDNLHPVGFPPCQGPFSWGCHTETGAVSLTRSTKYTMGAGTPTPRDCSCDPTSVWAHWSKGLMMAFPFVEAHEVILVIECVININIWKYKN